MYRGTDVLTRCAGVGQHSVLGANSAVRNDSCGGGGYMKAEVFVLNAVLAAAVAGALLPIVVIVIGSFRDFQRRLVDDYSLANLPRTVYIYVRYVIPQRYDLEATLRAMLICTVTGILLATVISLALVGLSEVLA